MRRSWSVIVALTASGLFACLDPSNPCSNDSCPEQTSCDPDTKRCVYRCDPACSDHQFCSEDACVPRYGAFVLETPQTGAYAGSPAAIVAKLQLARGTAYEGVGSASYNVTFEDGRDAGAGALTAGAEGRFSGSWVPPEQGTFKVAAHNATSALTSQTVTFNVDLTAPVFHVVAPAPARRVGSATESNENDPDLAGAWKRDEVATVVVSATEAIQGDSVILKVWGTTDGGVPANPASSFTVTPGTHAACNGRAYCGVVAVDLADIEMPIYRGRLAMEAQGQDLAGNAGRGDAGVPVTRLKWRFGADTNYDFFASPAVGRTGNLYFGGAGRVDTSLGKFYAVDRHGRVLWAADTGPVRASATVGLADGGMDRVYVGSTAGGIARGVTLSGVDGGVLRSCDFGDGDIQAALALGSSQLSGEAAVIETAFVVANIPGALPSMIRPDAPVLKCPTFTVAAATSTEYPTTTVTDGTRVLFGDSAGNFRSYSPSGANFVENFAKPTGLSFNGAGLTGSTFVAGGLIGTSGLYGGNTTDGGTVWRNSSVGANSVTIASSGEVVAGVTSTSALIATVSGSTATTRTLGATNVKAAPLLGEDGRMYFASAGGSFTSWSDDERLEWTATGIGSSFEASPNVDCARGTTGAVTRGRPATAYVLATGGTLSAISIDSRGLDTSAPWPKWQHDPRNTGNSSTPMAEFDCR